MFSLRGRDPFETRPFGWVLENAFDFRGSGTFLFLTSKNKRPRRRRSSELEMLRLPGVSGRLKMFADRSKHLLLKTSSVFVQHILHIAWLHHAISTHDRVPCSFGSVCAEAESDMRFVFCAGRLLSRPDRSFSTPLRVLLTRQKCVSQLRHLFVK
jgi:hypothetical protein